MADFFGSRVQGRGRLVAEPHNFRYLLAMGTFHSFSEAEIARALYPWGLVEHVEPRPFDVEACIDRYRRGLPHRTSTDAHPWRDDFTRSLSGKRGVITDEEAKWWFTALTDPARLDADRGHFVTKQSLTRPVLLDVDVRASFTTWIEAYESRYRNTRLYGQAYLARLMLQLVGLAETVSILLDSLDVAWLSSFLDELYPSEGDDMVALERTVRSWVSTSWTPPSMHPDRRRFAIASANARERLLPLARPSDLVQEALERLSAERAKLTSSVLHLVAALPDDERFIKYMELLNPEIGRQEVVLVVGRLGEPGCEWLSERVRRMRREPSEGLVRALAKIRTPTIVPALLHLAEHPTTANASLEVLRDADIPYATGLAEVAIGRTKSKELAAELLAQLEKDEPSIYLAAMSERDEDDRAKVEGRVAAAVVERRPMLDVDDWTPWMLDLACEEKPKGLPRFCSANRLRPIYLADGVHELHRNVVWGLLVELRDKAWVDNPRRVLGANARVDLDTASLADFVEHLYIDWTRAGFPAAQRWAMFALLEVLDDRRVLELADDIEEWPTLGEHDRAYEGLRVLELHGSDTALASLNKLSRSSRFRGLRTRAATALQKLGARRGMTPGELEDIIIDDCGLDPGGTTTFDYGGRTFTLTFDEKMTAVIDSSEGKRTKSLPRARKAEDAELAAREKDRFKTIKKRVSEVVKLQTKRLEHSLAEQRTWSAAAWRSHYLAHPMMQHLVQRLIWSTVGEAEARQFRVTASRELVDVDDEPFELRAPRVCLAHPATLNDEKLAQWGATLADYEIIPPFAQLERPVYRANDVPNLNDPLWDVVLHPRWLRGHFTRLGWSKSYPEGERFRTLYRDFHASEVRAYLALNPGLALDYNRDEDQQVVRVWFARRDGRHETELHPRNVPQVAFSEAYRDVLDILQRAGEPSD